MELPALPVLPALPSLAPGALEGRGFRWMGGHLGAVRLWRDGRPDLAALRQRPLLVYMNRASSWDPAVCVHLAGQLLPGRPHFAPLGADELHRQPLYGRLGFFAVDAASAWGARRLLEAAQCIFSLPEAVLWLAPAGAPADPRRRPAALPGGLGRLVSRMRRGVVVPLAVEYPFWEGRRPEALLRFGEEIAVEEAGMRARDWTDVLAAQLEKTQDALAAAAIERDASRFETFDTAAATGRGAYEVWRRVATLLRRRRQRKAAPEAAPIR
jgi:hypothetical protein